MIKSVDVLTGSLNAEYGVATSGVLAITTKSGFDNPFFLAASAQEGAFNSRDAGIQVGGSVGGTSAAYFGLNASTTDRYLDPITSGDPNHDAGSACTFSESSTRYSVTRPTSRCSPATIQLSSRTQIHSRRLRLRTRSRISTTTWSDFVSNTIVGESSFLSVLGYQRQSAARITSGGLTTLETAADFAKAIQEHEKFFIGGDRRYTTTGGQIEFSAKPDWWSKTNSFKAGVSVEVYPVHEQFSFAVTNPALSDTSEAGGDLRFRPSQTSRRVGTRSTSINPKQERVIPAYLQNQTMFERWVLNAGVRIDEFNFLQDEFSVSPRIGIGYTATDALTLRLSYNRIVMQAPLENILVSSSDQARQLTGAEQGSTPTSVRSEKANVFELGAGYRLNEQVDLDLVGLRRN